MDDILLLIRIGLAAIFALAGIGKFLDLSGSEKAVKEFGTPEFFAKPVSILLPIAEIAIAILLIPVMTSYLGAIGAFVLLLIFSIGMIVQLAKGNAPDCHCFGQIHSEPVGKKSLIRNLAFLGLSAVLIFRGNGRLGRSLFDSTGNFGEGSNMQLFFGLATVGLLIAVVYFLRQISGQQAQIIRRIEILELVSGEGKTVERADAAPPEKGLPIGAFAPEFALPDLNGKNFSLTEILPRDRALLLFFVSPTCSPCSALLPEIEAWQEEFKERVEIVLVSSGNAKENASKLGGKTFKKIFLQEEREVATKFGAPWTPSCVLVNSDGRIASRAAAGDESIRKLIEQIRAEKNDNAILFVRSAETNGHESSPLGREVPQFSFEDVNGKTISSAELRGSRTLIANWSLGCGYCSNMLDDLRAWDKARSSDEPNLVLISDGEAEANRGLGLSSPIVLDTEKKLATALALNGTPTAVLVNENGTVISDVAVGAQEIWSVVRKTGAPKNGD